MEVIIRVALMFFFIQFLVVITILVIALLLAQPEVPVLGRGPRSVAWHRILACVIHLPSRVLHSVVRRVHSIHSLLDVH